MVDDFVNNYRIAIVLQNIVIAILVAWFYYRLREDEKLILSKFQLVPDKINTDFMLFVLFVCGNFLGFLTFFIFSLTGIEPIRIFSYLIWMTGFFSFMILLIRWGWRFK